MGVMSDQLENDGSSAVEDAFARLGIPFTLQRRRVWEYFSTCGRAATIAEAAEALASGGTSQATVYRTVTLLTDMGLLVRVRTDKSEACYTAISVGHGHPLVCGRCRKIVEFDGEGDLSILERHLETTTGFSVYGHHLEVYGICPECAAKVAEARVEPDPSESSGG